MLYVVGLLELTHVVEVSLSPLLCGPCVLVLDVTVQVVLTLYPVSIVLLQLLLVVQIQMVYALLGELLNAVLQTPLPLFILYTEDVVPKFFLLQSLLLPFFKLQPPSLASRLMDICLIKGLSDSFLIFLYLCLFSVLAVQVLKHLTLYLSILHPCVHVLVLLDL